MMSSAALVQFPSPIVFSHFELIGELGRGTTGVVYEARDTSSGAVRAVKLLRPEADREGEERRSRFLREAQTAIELQHPNIARVFEVDEVRLDGETMSRLGLVSPAGEREMTLPYLSMERVAGEDLERRLARGLDLDSAIDLLGQVLDALAEAHSRGIVHRDLKPGNVMVTPDGCAKLLDFGLAKQLAPVDDAESAGSGTQLTLDGMVVGSLPYLAPEQLQGDSVRRRGDLFSFGVLAYELLAGSPPFPGNSMLEFARALLGPPPPAPSARCADLPPWIDAWVMPLLALDPDDRPASADVVREGLRRGAEAGCSSLSMPATVSAHSAPHSEAAATSDSAKPVRIEGRWRRWWRRRGAS